MSRKTVEQLKSLRESRAGGAPDARWLVSTRETLLMQIKNTVGEKAPSRGFSSFAEAVRLFTPSNLGRLVAVPVVMLLLVVGANFGASAIVGVSKDTLPGDALYGVKLLAERLTVQFAGSHALERQLEIAGRRLDEMSRLAASTDPSKEQKIADASVMFSSAMEHVDAGLQSSSASPDALRLASLVDAKADEYQKAFSAIGLNGQPSLRVALLSLDRASVSALELIVEKRAEDSGVYTEAKLSAAVGQKIDTFASHVAADTSITAPASEQVRQAVAEAKTLLSNGDFKAAVLKVRESADLVSAAETQDNAASSASATTETSASATPQ